MKKLLLSIPLLFVFGFSSLTAQTDVWTLERCFKYAKENNIQLKQSEINTEFAELDLEQSKNNRLPFVNGSASQFFSFGRSQNPITFELNTRATPVTSFGLNTGIDLYRGSSLKNSIKRSELALKNTEVQNKIQENNLELNIVSAYLEILKAKDQLKVLQEQTLISQSQKERTEKLINAGVLPQGDILSILAQISNEELRIVNAENSLEFATLNLRQILEYYEGPLEVVYPSIAPPSANELSKKPVDEIYAKAIGKLPEVQSAQLQTEIAEKDVDIAKANKKPSVSLVGGASTNFLALKGSTVSDFELEQIGFAVNGLDSYEVFAPKPVFVEGSISPFFTQLNNNLSYNIGLNVTIPIFNRYQFNNNIERSKLAVRNADLSSRITKNNLYQAIQQAYQAARSAAIAYESNLSSIESLNQALTNVEKRYELGMATALEYESARNNVAVARLNINSALYEYVFRLKILDFYEGKQIKF